MIFSFVVLFLPFITDLSSALSYRGKLRTKAEPNQTFVPPFRTTTHIQNLSADWWYRWTVLIQKGSDLPQMLEFLSPLRQYFAPYKTEGGTVVGVSNFDVVEEARKILPKPTLPKVANTEEFDYILPQLTFEQRTELAEQLNGKYDGTGSYTSLVTCLMNGPDYTLFRYLNIAMELQASSGLPWQRIVVSILIIFDQRTEFIRRYNQFAGEGYHFADSLRKISDNDPFKHFLADLSSTDRAEDVLYVDQDLVNEDVAALINECRNGFKESSTLHQILITKPVSHAISVLQGFFEQKFVFLELDIERNVSSPALRYGYMALVNYLKYGRLEFVAMCLHDALVVDDKNATMILFVTYFSESYLADIKRIYYQKYGKTLKEDCLQFSGTREGPMLAAIIGD